MSLAPIHYFICSRHSPWNRPTAAGINTWHHEPGSASQHWDSILICPVKLRSCHFYVKVAWNRGNPKSSILVGFHILNHPFWGSPFVEPPHVAAKARMQRCSCEIGTRFRPWHGQMQGAMSLATSQYLSQGCKSQIYWLVVWNISYFPIYWE